MTGLFQMRILPMLNELLHNSEKVSERNYPDRLNDPDLQSHHDAPFIRAALASSDKALVTSDGRLKDLLRKRLPALQVLTPREAYLSLRKRTTQNQG